MDCRVRKTAGRPVSRSGEPVAGAHRRGWTRTFLAALSGAAGMKEVETIQWEMKRFEIDTTEMERNETISRPHAAWSRRCPSASDAAPAPIHNP